MLLKSQKSMSKSRLLILTFTAGSVVCVPSWGTAHQASPQRATPPDSFLVTKVYSLDQLIEQVSTNSKVRHVYAKQFNVPDSRVVSYMRANLVESYVPDTKRYTVYCVRKNGLIYPVEQTFKKGTKVFALRNGQPVMKWLCGNPLSKFLPPVETRVYIKKVPVIKVSPSVETITPADTLDIVVPTEAPTAVFQPAVPILVGPTSASASTPFYFSTGGAGLGPAYLAPLLLVPFVKTSGSNSGGQAPGDVTTGGTTTGGTTTGGTDTTGGTTTGGATIGGTTTTGGTDTTGGTTTGGTDTTGGTTTGGTDTTGGTTTNGGSTTGGSTTGIIDTTNGGTLGGGTTTGGSTTIGGSTTGILTTTGTLTTNGGDTGGDTGGSPVPEPGTPATFAAGALGLIAAARFRRMKLIQRRIRK